MRWLLCLMLLLGCDDAVAPVDSSDAGQDAMADAFVPLDAENEGDAGIDAASPESDTSTPDASAPLPEHVVVCGRNTFVLDVSTDEPERIWELDLDASGLPEEVTDRMNSLGECKPLPDRLLGITANAGGVGIIDMDTGEAIFHAIVPKAHSIEIHPAGWVVVAAASDNNKLVVFDIERSDEPVFELEFTAAHGLWWDESRQRLWATGHWDLSTYAINEETGELTWDETFTLPTRGGHDLRPDPISGQIMVTSGRNVVLFDPETEAMNPLDPIGDHRKVKGIDIHPETGRIVYVQAPSETWYSDRLTFLTPEGEILVEEDRPYKARWMPFWLTAP